MNIDIRKIKNIVIVKPHADIRIKTILSLKSHLELLEKEAEFAIAIDLSMVAFIDSSGIGLLANFARRVSKRNIMTCLFNYSREVKELLDITGIDQAMRLFDREKDMLLAFEGEKHVAK
jgi:anti-sigma B factor antagonist